MHYHRAFPLAVAALLLLAPAAASAKQVTRAEVCGAADCVVVTDRGELRALLDIGPAADGPKEPGSYYDVRLTLSAGEEAHTSTLVYLPSARRFGIGDPGRYDWFAASPAAAALLDVAARRLDPLPGPVVRGVPLGRTAATTAGGGFPWAVPAVLVGMLGVLALGWAGQRAVD